MLSTSVMAMMYRLFRCRFAVKCYCHIYNSLVKKPTTMRVAVKKELAGNGVVPKLNVQQSWCRHSGDRKVGTTRTLSAPSNGVRHDAEV
jgi:hypothetical protein